MKKREVQPHGDLGTTERPRSACTRFGNRISAAGAWAWDRSEVVAALARAIHYAHSRGVLHRDLKPANVLLTEDGTPKLIDFSLAKLMENGSNDSTLTNDGQPIGTPSYMAPCQLVGRSAEIGPRTDVYGLGAILYECLAGQPPLKGDSALDTLRLVESVRPDPPSLLNDRVPNGLEAICLKCLRKRSNRRYSSAADLADALQAWLDCQAPLPDAPGP